MTRFLFNQFSKQFLEEFLTPLGIVERSREVSIQCALESYASEMDLSPNTVVQLAISYFLE